MSAAIRIASTTDERQEIYRFRYRIYVQEMGRAERYADHVTAMVEEPLDKHALILGAWEGDHVVGTMRQNIGSLSSDFGGYVDEYRMREFGPFFPSRISMTTRLMVAPEYRRGTLTIQMFSVGFRNYVDRGVAFDLIDCNRHLRELFFRFGYRQVFAGYKHPIYGDVTPLVLALQDRKHLATVRSPFRKLLDDVPVECTSVKWFRDRFRTLASSTPSAA